jgi:hypothetical protein
MAEIPLDPLYIFTPDLNGTPGGYYTSFDDVGKSDKIKNTPSQQAIAAAIYNKQQNSEFGLNRFAICLLPGTYTYTDVIEVAFYTTLSGLGLNPDGVIINSMNDGEENPVRCTYKYDDTLLTNFWRSCENMTLLGEQTYWYVSQAAPLNNMMINGNLYLAETTGDPKSDYASGGFIGNSIIKGNGDTGDTADPPLSSVKVYSQQQWCNLNSTFNKFSNTVWNLTNIGCDGDLQVVPPPFPNPPPPPLRVLQILKKHQK